LHLLPLSPSLSFPSHHTRIHLARSRLPLLCELCASALCFLFLFPFLFPFLSSFLSFLLSSFPSSFLPSFLILTSVLSVFRPLLPLFYLLSFFVFPETVY